MQINESRKFFTQKEVSDRWRISIRTLEGWRYRGIGPDYTKIGARILYPIEAIERHEEEGLINTGVCDD